QAVLTLPGIAGIILTIGMAVDSNVLIFERIREELRTGKSVVAAVDAGFGKAWWTIVDTHVTTVVSCAFLFLFGEGPVRGFAVTGFASIAMQGGLRMGIDFKGGALMTVKFAYQPPMDKIRTAFRNSGKIKGDVSVQDFRDPQAKNEVEIGSELMGEQQLNVN